MASQAICSVDGCGKPVRARGWCVNHWARWKRNGGVGIELRARNGAPQKFVREVAVKHLTDECLIWPFCVYSGGYGGLNFGGRKRGAHTAVCELVHGPQPSKNHEVAHSCGVRLCCNPRHLRWATRAENHADKIAHGTSVRGERSGVSKLKEAEVLQIKALIGIVSQNKLAKQFGVGASTIRCIREGRTWGWLK
jgi:hypothetical protein